ncbi:MAG: hypothetical protein ACXWDO_00730 [Bacteroidia bacterium]
MKYFFYASLFLVSSIMFSCAGNEQTEQQEDQMETEHHDSLQNSVLEEADKALSTGDTTVMPTDSAEKVK